MRLVATEYLTLDGVFEEPGHWSGPWFDDEAGQFKFAEIRASDALLLGRKTYEGFAAAWPTMPGTGGSGKKLLTEEIKRNLELTEGRRFKEGIVVLEYVLAN